MEIQSVPPGHGLTRISMAQKPSERPQPPRDSHFRNRTNIARCSSLPARNGHEKGGRPHALPPLAERLLEEIPCVVNLLTNPARLTRTSGDAVVVNPEISSGLPIQGVNRWPPPASRPERYNTPATKGA